MIKIGKISHILRNGVCIIYKEMPMFLLKLRTARSGEISAYNRAARVSGPVRTNGTNVSRKNSRVFVWNIFRYPYVHIRARSVERRTRFDRTGRAGRRFTSGVCSKLVRRRRRLSDDAQTNVFIYKQSPFKKMSPRKCITT